MNQAHKKILLFFIRLALAVGLIWAIFHFGKIDFGVFKEKALKWQYLLAGIAAGLIPISLAIYRWKILLREQGAELPFFGAWKLTFIGYFFNIFLPSGMGGDLVKAYYISTLFKDRGTEVVTSVFFDRLMGLSGLLAVALLDCAVMFLFFWDVFNTSLKSVALGIVGVSALFVLFVLFGVVLFSRRFRNSNAARALANIVPFKTTLSRIYTALHAYRKKPGLVLATLMLSMVCHAVPIFSSYIFALALGIDIPFYAFAFLMPIIVSVNMIPGTPMNIGVTEGAFVILFGLVPGVSEEVAADCFWIGAMGHGVRIGWGMLGGVFYIQGKEKIKKALEKRSAYSLSIESTDDKEPPNLPHGPLSEGTPPDRS